MSSGRLSDPQISNRPKALLVWVGALELKPTPLHQNQPIRITDSCQADSCLPKPEVHIYLAPMAAVVGLPMHCARTSQLSPWCNGNELVPLGPKDEHQRPDSWILSTDAASSALNPARSQTSPRKKLPGVSIRPFKNRSMPPVFRGMTNHV